MPYKKRQLNVAFGVAFTIIISGLVCNGLPKNTSKVENAVASIVERTVEVIEVQKVEASEPVPETVEDIITRYFPENPDKAIKIAKCEDNYYGDPVGWKPANHNPTPPDDSWGIFQINRYGKLALSRPSAEWLSIPENNIKYARQIWESKKTFANDWVICSQLYNKGKLK